MEMFHTPADEPSTHDEDDDDVFLESEKKRKRWTMEEEDATNSPNLNFFQILYRASLTEHKNHCEVANCKNCTVIPEDSLNWDARFRYGNLASRYRGKTLRQIVFEKGWSSNSTTPGGQNQPNTKPFLSVIDKLRKQIAQESEKTADKQITPSTNDILELA